MSTDLKDPKSGCPTGTEAPRVGVCQGSAEARSLANVQ